MIHSLVLTGDFPPQIVYHGEVEVPFFVVYDIRQHLQNVWQANLPAARLFLILLVSDGSEREEELVSVGSRRVLCQRLSEVY